MVKSNTSETFAWKPATEADQQLIITVATPRLINGTTALITWKSCHILFLVAFCSFYKVLFAISKARPPVTPPDLKQSLLLSQQFFAWYLTRSDAELVNELITSETVLLQKISLLWIFPWYELFFTCTSRLALGVTNNGVFSSSSVKTRISSIFPSRISAFFLYSLRKRLSLKFCSVNFDFFC